MFKIRAHHRHAGTVLILLFASLCATAQRPSEPDIVIAETKSGVITGRVVNENGQPHLNAKVWVFPNTPDGVPIAQTTTNRNGVFKVSGLQNGSYKVLSSVPACFPKLSNPRITFKDGELVTLVLMKGGAITGTVTNVKGEPVVGIGVRVRLVRNESGRDFGDNGEYYENVTDDRGVYRVYGIPTGTYVVSADGSLETRYFLIVSVNGFANDLPTYAPSSDRENASEITVRFGDEVSDVNIRYRGEHGSTISGIVSGLYENHRGYDLILNSIAEGRLRQTRNFQNTNGEFAFDGVPDGEYQLAAYAHWNDSTFRKSESLFLNVRGADIEGLVLTPALMVSIDGRVVREALKTPPPECTEKTQPQFSDMSANAWQRVIEGEKKKPQFVSRVGGAAKPNGEGRLLLAGIPASEYYFTLRFSSQQWFLQSIDFAPPNGKPVDASRTWTILKPGDQLTGLTFTLAQGAGSVRGEIPLAEGQTLPEKLVAYLIPVEPEKAEDALRYFAAPVSSAGRFVLSNVAPGRYWMLAQPGSDDTQKDVSKFRLPDGALTRSSLRHAAKAAKTEIEIKPCQDVTFRLPL